MSDQAEKLRQKMKSLRDPLCDLGFISIIEVQPGSLGAVFAYQLAATFVALDQTPFLLDIEKIDSEDEQLSLLLNLNNPPFFTDNYREVYSFGEGDVLQKDGMMLATAALFNQSDHYKPILRQVGAYLSKKIPTHFNPLLVYQSAFETFFLDEIGKASVLLLVTKSDPSDLVEAYTLIKHVHAISEHLPIGIVLTHSGTPKEAETAFQNLNAVTLRFLGRSLLFCGRLSSERVLSRSLGKRKDEKSLYVKSVELILKRWAQAYARGESS